MEKIDKLGSRDQGSYEIGKQRFREGNYSQAIENFLKALEQEPDNADALFELGKTHCVIGEYRKAVEYLKKNLEIRPGNGLANILLAKCYIFFDDYNLALEELNKAVEKNPSPEVYYELGMVYEIRGDYHRCVDAFKKAVGFGLDLTGAHLQLGRAYREIGEYELSVRELEMMHPLPPYSENLFYKNKLLNEIEISQRKTVIDSKPLVLGVALTHNCNIRCKMCRYWSDPWDVPENIINEIMELFPYLQHVYWQGGGAVFFKIFQ